MAKIMLVRVFSIFESFDGEVNHWGQGRRAVFVRLAGCNLTCSYCDTVRAQGKETGEVMTINEVVTEITNRTPNKITFTGGEPLLQAMAVSEIIYRTSIIKPNLQFSIETNGSIKVPEHISQDVSIVMDWKLSSANAGPWAVPSKRIRTYMGLSEKDYVKFVIGTPEDFLEAVTVTNRLKRSGCRAKIAFSPLYGELEPSRLAEWLLSSPLPEVILNLQLHKYIWPDAGEREV